MFLFIDLQIIQFFSKTVTLKYFFLRREELLPLVHTDTK
jgi:hypothetical protein